MGMNKRAMLLAASCAAAYLLLAIVLVLSNAGVLFCSCLVLSVITNGITSLYARPLSGRRSLVLLAVAALVINVLFLALRLGGIYLGGAGAPSDGEVVATVVMIAGSVAWVVQSVRLLRARREAKKPN